MSISEIFKPHLQPKSVYKGGKNIPPTTKKIYKLSSNENPLGASQKAIAAIQKASETVGLYPDQTDERLRLALSKHHGHRLDAHQFLTGNSGSEIIDHILRAIINPGDEVIYSNPCFLPYSVFSSWYGAVGIDVPLKKPDYTLDVEGILKVISSKTKVIFLTSPNNPTGTYLPKDLLNKLLSRVPENILVVLDEVYRHFATAEDYTTAETYVEQGYSVLGLNSFSKTYGLAGMRIGYAYTTEEIAAYLRLIQKPFLLPITAIEGGIAALNDQEFLDKTVQTVLEGRHFLEKAYHELGIRYWPSQANFHMIDPPLGEQELTEALMQQGIMVRPVSQFGAPGMVRITVGNAEANKALVKALQKLLG